MKSDTLARDSSATLASTGNQGVAISVMTKRGGARDWTGRDFWIKRGGIQIEPALRDFSGVLAGVPIHEQDADNLRAGIRP